MTIIATFSDLVVSISLSTEASSTDSVVGRHLRLRPRHPFGVDDHVRLRGVFRRRNGDVKCAEDDPKSCGQYNEAPLAGKKVANLKQGGHSRVRVVPKRRLERGIVELVRKVHEWLLNLP